MVEDDDGKPSEPVALIKTTTVAPETGTAHLLKFHPREELKTHSCSDVPDISESPVEPLNRLTSSKVAEL